MDIVLELNDTSGCVRCSAVTVNRTRIMPNQLYTNSHAEQLLWSWFFPFFLKKPPPPNTRNLLVSSRRKFGRISHNKKTGLTSD